MRFSGAVFLWLCSQTGLEGSRNWAKGGPGGFTTHSQQWSQQIGPGAAILVRALYVHCGAGERIAQALR